ncbi:MAG: hypothetical protein ABIJ34_09685 [archaeon]
MKYRAYLEKLLTKYDEKVLIDEFEHFLEKKYSDDQTVPLSIFCKELTPFESLTLFMVEYKKSSFSEIAGLLKKDRQVVWITYQRARGKKINLLKDLDWKSTIPLSAVCSETLSVAESLALFLKKSGWKNKDIAKTIGKDSRTIWTLLDRAKKKGGSL